MHFSAALFAALGVALGLTTLVRPALAAEGDALRPPSVPLVACDPYFSIWSAADHLTDEATRHWTGRTQSLTSMIRVDGKAYRLMGNASGGTPALPQAALQVLPTRTIYEFANSEIKVTLTFMTPALPDDLDLVSRPVTYLTWDVQSADGKPHQVELYYDNTAEPAVNNGDQPVVWQREKIGNLTALRFGTQEQPVLQKRGDDLRIDWGYLYAAAPSGEAKTVFASGTLCADEFATTGKISVQDDTQMPRRADEKIAAAFVFDLKRVEKKPVSRTLLLAYDDLYSITYFGRKLRPYWRRNGMDAAGLISQSAKEYAALKTKCSAFDTALMADLTRMGGAKYAKICALAYRQCLAANKIAADANGQPLLFPKENFSNGCIATVDVIYPMEPLFLLFSPTLTKASLATVLGYASSPRWKFPFAPHDLGTYPQANGQVYGGGERTEDDQMPVEETGNILILLAALAKQEGNADFAGKYWPQITRWADYLEQKGFDPENQLCTDDFAGHLAHNVNLSVKAIEGLASYGMLCRMRGDRDAADKYETLSRQLAQKWMQEAADGDHTKLAFDKPGTWSQKYNMVWDTILGFHLFTDDVRQREVAFYKSHINQYGVPLDSRRDYTKTDWTIWSATMANNAADFEVFINPIYDSLNASPSRVPLTDWYETKNAKMVGFQARSVVGGFFIKMLTDAATWKKWAKADKKVTGNYAALPTPPVVKSVVPTAQDSPTRWHYTTDKPDANWYEEAFDDTNWKTGESGFGTAGTPSAIVHTVWNTGDIWMRRTFDLPATDLNTLKLWVFHDEDVEIYINGVLAGRATGYITSYEAMDLLPAGRAALRPGQNTFAVHCHQTTGGQFVDVGLSQIIEK